MMEYHILRNYSFRTKVSRKISLQLVMGYLLYMMHKDRVGTVQGTSLGKPTFGQGALSIHAMTLPHNMFEETPEGQVESHNSRYGSVEEGSMYGIHILLKLVELS